MVSEFQKILKACQETTVPKGNYHVSDYVLNLQSTVLDYQMNPTTLANAERHYKQNHWLKIRMRDDLGAFLAK